MAAGTCGRILCIHSADAPLRSRRTLSLQLRSLPFSSAEAVLLPLTKLQCCQNHPVHRGPQLVSPWLRAHLSLTVLLAA
jgi:hypothetical protein